MARKQGHQTAPANISTVSKKGLIGGFASLVLASSYLDIRKKIASSDFENLNGVPHESKCGPWCPMGPNGLYTWPRGYKLAKPTYA